MKLFPIKNKIKLEPQQPEDRYINLNHTKMLVETHPKCKQIIHMPDNTCITDKNINQVIDIFNEETCDDLQYMVQSTVNIENMLININIIPIVKSA